jgi:hypothetical protein
MHEGLCMLRWRSCACWRSAPGRQAGLRRTPGPARLAGSRTARGSVPAPQPARWRPPGGARPEGCPRTCSAQPVPALHALSGPGCNVSMQTSARRRARKAWVTLVAATACRHAARLTDGRLLLKRMLRKMLLQLPPGQTCAARKACLLCQLLASVLHRNPRYINLYVPWPADGAHLQNLMQ